MRFVVKNGIISLYLIEFYEKINFSKTRKIIMGI